MKWRILIEELAKDNPYVKLNPPASEQQIHEVEKKLDVPLPDDLADLLREFNGDSWLIFSTEQIIETNLSIREALDSYMPLDCLLFFGGNGCGDYFGYPITRGDGVRNDNVFMWEHEWDNRIWKANNLEDTIRKYYNNEI
jgi:hypothetical protein